MREILHATLLPGIALSESARSPTPIRLQGAQNKSVRVRRVRPHDERTRSPLSPSQRKTPVQPGVAQILR